MTTVNGELAQRLDLVVHGNLAGLLREYIYAAVGLIAGVGGGSMCSRSRSW